MGVNEEREQLSNEIKFLKQDLDRLDFDSINDIEVIYAELNQISDTCIQRNQFISRRGINDWNSWGSGLWNDIERHEAALKRLMERIERQDKIITHKFDRKVTRWSLIFMAISAIAAAFSSYCAYLSAQKSTVKPVIEIQKSAPTPSMKKQQPPLND